MNKSWVLIFLIIWGCSKDHTTPPLVMPLEIVGVDMSITPELKSSGYLLRDENQRVIDVVDFLKSKGVTTVRLRLWNHSSDIESKSLFANQLHAKGIKVFLSLHYSDTWADPGNQEPPQNWKGLSLANLSDSVFVFTQNMTQLFSPDYIQIGNEINSGLLHPTGHIDSTQNFHLLLSQGIKAVREVDSSTQIVLHFAGIDNADSFYQSLDTLDYDIAGLSYYPMWHGADVDKVSRDILDFESTLMRPWLLAETSYPFTLNWNDWTHNLLGESGQLAMGYPATPQGQVDFIKRMKSIIRESNHGLGYCYWAGDWVAFKGTESTEGSPVENQAFFNFSGHALPIVNHLD